MIEIYKRLLLCFLLIAACCVLSACNQSPSLNIEFEVDPSSVAHGMTVELTLTANSDIGAGEPRVMVEPAEDLRAEMDAQSTSDSVRTTDLRGSGKGVEGDPRGPGKQKSIGNGEPRS